MAITAAEIETLVDAGNAAAAGGDYATALSKFRQAKALLSALPDSVKDGNELTWDRNALDSLIADYKAEVSAASTQDATAGDGTGVQRTKIKFVRAEDESDW